MSTKQQRLALMAFSTFMVVRAADASLIWDGDASKGTGVFGTIGSNCASPGTVTAVSDSTQGTVWRFSKPSGLDRCEAHGISVNGSMYVFQNGSTYYLGWRNKLTNLVDNNANFQWKSYPTDGSLQNWPIVIKMISNRVTMIQRQPGSVIKTVWSSAISANTWNHYVVSIHVSDQTLGGWVELWYNGVMQTLSNGSTRWPCRTLDGTNDPKWGVYGATSSAVINYVDGLRVGTTYSDVSAGGATPTPTPRPTSTPTPVSTPTPRPTPTPTPVAGYVEVTPSGSAVTASTNDGNIPANAVDNNLATRWSANGDGQWIQLDLGTARTIGYVNVALYQGNTRTSRFDIQVSNGSGLWTTVWSGSSSGTTTAEQKYDFTDVSARWVRYLGHGNSLNLWNSVSEVSVFAAP
jgi:hypothetical protein